MGATMDAPTLPARLAFACLLALAFLLTLLPVEGTLAVYKHIVFLSLACLGALCLWWDAVRGRAAPALGTPVDLGVIVLAAVAVPSAALSANPGMSRYALGLVVAMTIAYLLALKTVRTPRDVRVLFVAVFLAGFLVSLLGLDGYRRFLVDGAPEAERRAYLSTPLFAHSYLAAQYLVMVFVGGVVVLMRAQLERRWRVAVTAGLLFIGAYLLVIGSRGAYAAVAAALSVSLVLYLRSGPRRQHRVFGLGVRTLLLAGGILGVAVAVTAWGASGETGRLSAAFAPVVRDVDLSRLAIWKHAVAMGSDHLITGAGIGAFDTVFPSYRHSPVPVPHAHNQFLHVFAELGLLGLIAFLFLVQSATHAARKGAYALGPDDERRPLLLAAVAALSAALVYFLFETPLAWVEAGSLIFVLLAIVTRAGCHSRTARTSPPLAWAALALLVGVMVWVVPAWSASVRASTLADDHRERLTAALASRAAGETEQAGRQLADLSQRLIEADHLFPHRADFSRLLAESLAAFGDNEKALAAYRLADRRVPGSFAHLNAIGELLMTLERPAEAIEPLREAIVTHRGPSSAETYALLARAYRLTDRSEEAWLIFDDLIRRHFYHHEQPRVLLDAAWALVALQRYTNTARELVTEYRKLRPGDDDPAVAELERVLDERLAAPRHWRR